MEKGCGINGSRYKGYRPWVLGRLGREGRQGCPHTVAACNHTCVCNQCWVLLMSLSQQSHDCCLGEPLLLPHNLEWYSSPILYTGWVHCTIQALYLCQPPQHETFTALGCWKLSISLQDTGLKMLIGRLPRGRQVAASMQLEAFPSAHMVASRLAACSAPLYPCVDSLLTIKQQLTL